MVNYVVLHRRRSRYGTSRGDQGDRRRLQFSELRDGHPIRHSLFPDIIARMQFRRAHQAAQFHNRDRPIQLAGNVVMPVRNWSRAACGRWWSGRGNFGNPVPCRLDTPALRSGRRDQFIECRGRLPVLAIGGDFMEAAELAARPQRDQLLNAERSQDATAIADEISRACAMLVEFTHWAPAVARTAVVPRSGVSWGRPPVATDRPRLDLRL